MSAGPSLALLGRPFQSRRNICAFILLAVSRSGPELLLCPGGAACFPGGRGNFYGWHGPGAGFDAGADPQRELSFRDAFSQGSYGCDSFPGGKWIHGTGADVESDVPSDPSQAFEYDDSGFDGSRAGAFDGFPCDLGQDGGTARARCGS